MAITAAMLDGTGLIPAYKRFPTGLRRRDIGARRHLRRRLPAKDCCRWWLSTHLPAASFDQVIHDVCLQKLPMLLLSIERASSGGWKTHQGLFDLSYLRCIPDLVVAAPRDENELQRLLHTAVDI